MYNSKLRKRAVENFNAAVERYVAATKKFEAGAENLYRVRLDAVQTVEAVTEKINSLAHTPREFTAAVALTRAEIKSFEGKQRAIEKVVKQAKREAKSSAAGASLGALGVAVATMGPTAAMSVATTFGVASTGTAIASLSGAAATNAALAWLGGGALAAGGGGMAAGGTLLALAGPVGWAIAGAAGVVSVGVGVRTATKNKSAAAEADNERMEIEAAIRRFDRVIAEISSLDELTRSQMAELKRLSKGVPDADYRSFSEAERKGAAMLVNGNLVLAELVNKELSVDADE